MKSNLVSELQEEILLLNPRFLSQSPSDGISRL